MQKFLLEQARIFICNFSQAMKKKEQKVTPLFRVSL